MIQKQQASPTLIFLAFASTYILWGTTYFAVLIGLQTLPPFVMGAFRFLLAAVILFIILFFKRQALWKKGIFQNIILGMVILTGGQGLLFWSEQYIPSGYTAILVSTLPLWYVLIDSKNRNMYFKNKIVLAGFVLGFVGIVMLFEKYIGAHTGITGMQLLGMLSVFGACICWVSGTLYYKEHVDQNFIFLNLAWQLMGGFLSSLVISFVSGEFRGFSLTHVSIHSWLATVYLAVAGSLVAFVAFTWLLSVRPAAVVGTYAYVNPIIAVLIGWMLANESISLLQIAGMVIILISAALVNSTKYKWGNKKDI